MTMNEYELYQDIIDDTSSQRTSSVTSVKTVTNLDEDIS